MNRLMTHHPLTPYALLLLPVLALSLFFLWPAASALHISFYHYDQLYEPVFAGWANYTHLVTAPRFLNALGQTALLLLAVVPAMVALPIGLALLLNQRLAGIEVVRVIAYLPVILSLVVVALAWKWLLAEQGPVNYLLGWLGVAPVAWLTHPQWALWAIAVVVVWKGLAYYAMMYLAQLQSIQAELYESARLDGANLWQLHWWVTLPHLVPSMLLVGLIASIGTLKLFTEIYVMTRGGPLHGTETLVYLIYQWAFEQLDLGLACAAGMVLALVLMTLSLVQLLLLGRTNRRWGH